MADDLQRQLGEFIHGCLSQAEAARMRARITSEPHVARAYAEAKQEADWLAKQGKCAAPPGCAAAVSSCSDASRKPNCCATSPACCGANRWRWAAGLVAAAVLFALGYFIFNPATTTGDDTSPLRLTTQLSPQKLQRGEAAQVLVVLENTSGESQPMAVAIIGLPDGLKPRRQQLEEHITARRFDSYELRPREIVFYWRGIAAKAQGQQAIRFAFDVVAESPGRSTGLASRAYLVYTPEKKHWAEPLAVEISP